MMKIIMTIGAGEYVKGIRNFENATLQSIRKQLDNKNYTELKTYRKGGKQIIEFVTGKVSRLKLIDAGLIRGSKKERSDYKAKTITSKDKYDNFGYNYKFSCSK